MTFKIPTKLACQYMATANHNHDYCFGNDASLNNCLFNIWFNLSCHLIF